MALGNAAVLPDVIIGGAEEEIKLEKLRARMTSSYFHFIATFPHQSLAEIEKETEAVQKEETAKACGKPVDQSVVYAKVTERLQAQVCAEFNCRKIKLML